MTNEEMNKILNSFCDDIVENYEEDWHTPCLIFADWLEDMISECSFTPGWRLESGTHHNLPIKPVAFSDLADTLRWMVENEKRPLEIEDTLSTGTGYVETWIYLREITNQQVFEYRALMEHIEQTYWRVKHTSEIETCILPHYIWDKLRRGKVRDWQHQYTSFKDALVGLALSKHLWE